MNVKDLWTIVLIAGGQPVPPIDDFGISGNCWLVFENEQDAKRAADDQNEKYGDGHRDYRHVKLERALIKLHKPSVRSE